MISAYPLPTQRQYHSPCVAVNGIGTTRPDRPSRPTCLAGLRGHTREAPRGPGDYARSGIDPPEIGMARGCLRRSFIARIKSFSLISLSLDISLSNTTSMASSDAEMDDSDIGSVLTDALQTETLEAGCQTGADAWRYTTPAVPSQWYYQCSSPC